MKKKRRMKRRRGMLLRSDPKIVAVAVGDAGGVDGSGCRSRRRRPRGGGADGGSRPCFQDCAEECTVDGGRRYDKDGGDDTGAAGGSGAGTRWRWLRRPRRRRPSTDQRRPRLQRPQPRLATHSR